MFGLRLHSEGLSQTFCSVVLLKILLIDYSIIYLGCDIKYCLVKFTYSCLAFALANVSTGKRYTGCKQNKKQDKILFYYLTYLFFNLLRENTLNFLTIHYLHTSRSSTFYSRKIHILFNALWSAEAFLHSVEIKDFHSFWHLLQISGYWFQFIPKMITVNQFKMQIYSFSVQKY